MTLPSLHDAAFLSDPGVRAVFAALDGDGEEVRVVGGAVRDALMQRRRGDGPVEVDFATTATPATIEARARAAGLRTVPTGIEHGTVTVLADGRGFEVTALRQDVETDGRHAVVRFGRDWAADARRRDFTMNALSIDASGKLFDPAGGYDDLLARRVRFIGDAGTRIAEDRLRLLRFFRFHAELGAGAPDSDALSAAIEARDALALLPAERIAHEMRRLVLGQRAAETVTVMQDAGILPLVLGGTGYPPQFARLVAFEAEAAAEPSAALRLAALSSRAIEDVDRVAARLRLSNAESSRMRGAMKAAAQFVRAPDESEARAARYRLGAMAFADGLALAAAMAEGEPGPWLRSLAAVADWPVPVFPITGNDLLGIGIGRGPAIGAMLAALEDWWIARGFLPDRTMLLGRVQQMAAAQQ